jgi:hypothetical protein
MPGHQLRIDATLLKINYQLIHILDEGVVKNLKKSAEVTFSCNRQDKACNFQFWVAGSESFYCSMSDCEFTGTQELKISKNTTTITCKHMSCKCIPGRSLCGEPGQIDLSEWMTDADEGPTGPATFSCIELPNDTGGNHTCRFEEPHMNDLVSLISKEPYFALACVSGECLHTSQVPGYARSPAVAAFPAYVVAMMILAAVGFVIAVVFSISALQRRSERMVFVDGDMDDFDSYGNEEISK